MKSYLIIIIAFISSVACAQDLHIYYDVFSDSSWFMKNGKVVEEASVKKGRKAIIHLVEYNNYIYRAEVSSNQFSQDPNQSAGTQNLFKSLIPGVLGSLIPGGGGGGLPFMDVPVYGKLLSTLTGAKGEQVARGENEEVEKFKSQLDLMEIEKMEINNLLAEINKRKKSILLLKASPDFINELSRMDNLKPSQIKALMNNYLDEALLLNSERVFVPTDIQSLNLQLLETPALQNQVEKKISNYLGNMASLKQQSVVLKGTDHGIDELYAQLKTLDSKEQEIKASVVRLAELVASDSATIDRDFTKEIYKYYLKYLELNNNSFTYKQEEVANERFMNYEVKLSKVNASNTDANGQSTSEFRSKSFDIRIYGNLLFTPSIGLAVGKFANDPSQYVVRENVIVTEEVEPYSIMVSSMINMAYDFNSKITPAISFGVGIPVTNLEKISEIAFLFGPSLMLGKSKSFLISGGWMFAKASRLANGLQVGDVVDLGDGVLPTKTKYELGYFLGVSYKF